MLSGCTTKEFHLGWYDKCLPKTSIEVKKVYPSIPVSKLRCGGIPKPGIMSKQSEVAKYLVDLTVAGKECESNLRYTRESLIRFTESNTTK